MRKLAVLALVVLLLGSVAVVWAQNPDTSAAPKYLWIETDMMKPSADILAYNRFIKGVKEAMSQSDIHWLAEYPVGGSGNQMTFVTFLDSGAALEKAVAEFTKVGGELMKKDAALVTQGTSVLTSMHYVLAKFEPDLSISPEKVDHSRMTRLRVSTFQLRPGAMMDFEELLKEVRELHTKANDGVRTIVWQVVAGGGPGFIIVRPMNSLAELDTPTTPAMEALMTPTVRKHLGEVLKDTVVKQTSEIYVVDPELSRPPESYIAANPDFWKVKMEETAAITPKGKKEKRAAVTPKP